MNSHQMEYLKTWNEAFAQFLGWNEEQTVSWAKPLLEDLALPGAVLNEPPLYYVARELASSQGYYYELSQRARFELIRTIQDVLAPDKAGRKFPSGFDFDSARRELDKVLRHGRSS